MVPRHAITTASCSHCRLAILKLFACSSNSLPSARIGALQSWPRSRATIPIRTFSSRPVQSESPTSGVGSAAADLEKDGELDSQKHESDEKDTNLANIPWYLQVEPPRHVATIEPPPLPEVPLGSPKVIGPLLEYISEDLGLHELSLLDLRELDPPPALGPSLFMLFGTARSERHLNVSAGRLLRWLQANHKIRAQADGLLGPNERKKKLRRKAKRAKLIGGIEDTDDGIKTGWICVNLGTIDRGKEESAVVAEDGRVAGFGVAQEGSTIVVQIMTESRRAEMGLETLWERALARSLGKSVKAEAVTLKSEPENRDNLHPLEKAILSSSQSRATPRNSGFGDTPRRTPFGQARFYSTHQMASIEAPEFNSLFNVQTPEELGQMLKYDPQSKRHTLQLLQAYLDRLSPQEAQDIFGSSSEESRELGGHPFTQLSKLACEALAPSQTWAFRFAVHAKACEISKNGSTPVLSTVEQLVQELCFHGIEATRQQYIQLLTCIYHSGTPDLDEANRLALLLLKTVQQRGQPILANDIIVAIIEGVTDYYQRSGSQSHLSLIGRLEEVLRQGNLPCLDEPLIMRLLQTYASIPSWSWFWNAWRMPPRHLRPRSSALYLYLFELMAASGSRALCMIALRRCFQEMLTEDPPVQPTGKLLTAILRCVHTADPNAIRGAWNASMDTNISKTGRALPELVKLVRTMQVFNDYGGPSTTSFYRRALREVGAV